MAAVQMASVASDVGANRRKAKEKVCEAAEKGAEIICLPELWSTGYGLSREEYVWLAETVDGPTVAEFRFLAEKLKVTLILPFPEKEGKELYISAAVISKGGKVMGVHRKALLWGNEQAVFTPGEPVYRVWQTNGISFGVLICYDAEFPESARKLALQGAELIFVPSVWSTTAEHRWNIQLPARALDNTCFVMGVNTIGENICGKSTWINPRGIIQEQAARDREEIIIGELDREGLKSAREQIPYLKDCPRFGIL
ncbi:nitrilase-related carbon-nitrogen hydrolase [Melghirimyces profundicolus]|uniref:nitrilase-related carbon-nitrogen hydrolase n=1 Tax=Melghirimyces profundicolus TaxID=1242148 RepID=UPI001FE87651|nr:nitrilase-related carbon-nitrogen hydrolase [Melghirimyces profundicolus]